MNNYQRILAKAKEDIESGEFIYICNALRSVYNGDTSEIITEWIYKALNGDTFTIYFEERSGMYSHQKYRTYFIEWMMENTHVFEQSMFTDGGWYESLIERIEREKTAQA